MEVVETIESENTYLARAWNRERAYRYVVSTTSGPVEASFFEHYLGDHFVKSVVELPTSFGCPVGCKYCASGQLRGSVPLSGDEMVEMCDLILNLHSNDMKNEVRVSFSGIGEVSLDHQPVLNAARSIAAHRPASFTFATVGARPGFLLEADRVSSELTVHTVQVTVLASDDLIVSRVIPTRQRYGIVLSRIVDAIAGMSRVKPRLNLVAIAGIADHPAYLSDLVSHLSRIRNSVSIRVAELNETALTRRNQLFPVARDRLLEIATELCEAGL